MLFGSTPADAAWVLSATQILVRTPPHDPGACALTIKNLDDGEPIAGETTTRSDAYQFKRPDLAPDTHLNTVVKELILDLRRQLLENSVLTTHTDYDDNAEDGLRMITTAELPVLVLVGPRTSENRFYSDNEAYSQDFPDGTHLRERPVQVVDLLFTVICATDNENELLNLLHLFGDYVQNNPYLYLRRGQDDQLRYEFAYNGDGAPRVQSVENLSNVRHFSAEVVVRAVPLIALDMAVEKTADLQDFVAPGEMVEGTRADIEWIVSQFIPEGS